ncbi:CAP domain-containing protein [uncultured Nocardioides sp.]|uniref:CAP domain-containing protein n=1 Tax=uncultured Nocardioides sp. TaxID=198441 RepID=UPI00262CBBC1|nr:CAP domain-containing protein [uncultured Nocardioides sp.]
MTPSRVRRRVLAPLCPVVLTALLVSPSAVAVAAEDVRGTEVPGASTRAEALDAYRTVQDAIAVPAGWTGSVDGCRVGTESAESKAATLASINALRSMVDAAPVRLDADLDRKALAAALMMRAEGNLSHDPGEDWACWSDEGDEAAGNSNLFLGYSGAQAMEGFVDDSGIDSLGHRRWLLNPGARTFGTGSTGSTNALWVFGPGSVTPPERTTVAWPPAGYVAEPWVFQEWSLEIIEADLTGLDRARVEVSIDGEPTAVTRVQPIDSYYTIGSGLQWRVPAASSLPGGDHDVTVTVSGITVDGDSTPITWSTTVVDPDGGDPPPVVDPPSFTSRPTVKPARGSTGAVGPGTKLVARWGVEGSDGETVTWTRDGRAMSGATGRSYVVRRADRGHALRAVVVATGEGGTATKRSNVVRVG